MNKTPFKRIILYIALGIMSIFVVYLFVTSKTYAQLGIAVITYPVLAFLIIKAMPRKTRKVLSNVVSPQSYAQTNFQSTPQVGAQVVSSPALQLAGNEDVVDIDKRTFLKLIGATGIFFFATSLIGKWLGTLPFSTTPPLSTVPSNNVEAYPETESGFTTNGYTITEIDEGLVSFYGFTNKSGAWLIMKEDSENNSFRYAKGDASFPNNWKTRATLKYDYYYNLE